MARANHRVGCHESFLGYVPLRARGGGVGGLLVGGFAHAQLGRTLAGGCGAERPGSPNADLVPGARPALGSGCPVLADVLLRRTNPPGDWLHHLLDPGVHYHELLSDAMGATT